MPETECLGRNDIVASLKNYILGIVFLSVSASQFLSPQLLKDPRLHHLVLQGIHWTLSQQYDSAETAFQTMIVEYPRHPAGYLYLAGMLQAKNTDYGDHFNEKRYDSLLNIVETLAQPLIEESSTAAAGYYYQGSAEAFRSYTRSENGNYPSGVYYGLSAGRSLEKCLELDPANTEVKNILGSFYFWRSTLSWIPFIPDRTEEGISFIKESFAHPYQKHLAAHNLVVILTEVKRYEEAEYYGAAMLREYPDNRLFLWNMMTVYEQWKKSDKVREVVKRLLSSTLNASVINRYTEATCRLKLALFELAEGKRDIAAEQAKQVIALNKYLGKTKGNLRRKITQAEELLTTIQTR